MVAMESINITIYVKTIFQSFKDMEQSYRVGTSRQSDDYNSAVKQSLTFGKFKDLIHDLNCIFISQDQNPLGKSSLAWAKKSSLSGGISLLSGIGGSGIGASSIVTLSKL